MKRIVFLIGFALLMEFPAFAGMTSFAGMTVFAEAKATALADSCEMYIEVTRVIDGDTFEGETKDGFAIRFRIAGIDAPEIGQYYGDVAKWHLHGLIYGRTVGLEVCRRDVYGRLVVWVYVDGEDIGAVMLREGSAWHYDKYDDCTVYSTLQADAKMCGRGLWSDDRPIEPWRWREMSKFERDAYRCR